MKKFLCICEGGTVRSVSLALALKQAGQDALAGSWRWNSPETLTLLCEWADYVVVMQSEFSSKVAPRFSTKLRAVDVGPDRYGHPLNLELCQFLQGVVAGWAKRAFEI